MFLSEIYEADGALVVGKIEFGLGLLGWQWVNVGSQVK